MTNQTPITLNPIDGPGLYKTRIGAIVRLDWFKRSNCLIDADSGYQYDMTPNGHQTGSAVNHPMDILEKIDR